MFFLFGWGRKMTKFYGDVLEQNCLVCRRKGAWGLYRVSKWFTLFFIPIFPYETIYYLVCPYCKSYEEIDRQRFEELKNQAIAAYDFQVLPASQEDKPESDT